MMMMRRHRESGSALTELAIVAPVFIVLVLWAQFFTDLGILRLKADEAARFALWEVAAQRPNAEIARDVQTRFSDLSSPTDRNSQAPAGVMSFRQVTIGNVAIADVDSRFNARESVNPVGGGGLLSRIVGFMTGLLNKMVDAVLRLYNFNTNGAAQATITIQARNTLFPRGRILGIDLSAPAEATNISMTVRSPVMLIDTWKAWPSRYAVGSRDINATPQSTYGRGSTPEREVSRRLDGIAFFGLGRWVDPFDRILAFLRGPGIVMRSTWASGGPVVMLPGAPAKHGWSPASGQPVQRAGDYTGSSSRLTKNIDSPNRNQTDRLRLTSPGEAINTGYWRDKGGMGGVIDGVPEARAAINPYRTALQCRDGFYMGAAVTELKRWNKTFGQWANQANPSCR
jgi:hypothetical protein